MNTNFLKVAFLVFWGLGYLPFGLTHKALAAACSMRIENYKEKNASKVTFSHAGCTLGELIQFSKTQNVVSRRVFDELLNRSLRGPTISSTPCEMPGCRPCQGGPGGKCELYNTLPKSVAVISVPYPGSRKPRTTPTPNHESTAPTTEEEKSFLNKFGLNEYTPSLEQPSVSLVLHDQGSDIFDSEWVNQMSQAGYLIATLNASPDALTLPGKTLSKAYDVIFKGINEKDLKLEKSLALRQEILQTLLQEATEAITFAAANLTQASDEIQISFKVRAHEIHSLFSQTTADLAQIRSQAQNSEGAVREISIVTSQKSVAQKTAEKTSQDIGRLRQSLLTDDAIQQSKDRLVQHLKEKNPSEIASFISGIQEGQIENSTNPALREQYENILRTVTDRRGIVTAAAMLVGLQNDLNLDTKETSSVGRAVRQNLNEALLTLARGSGKSDVSYALKAVYMADQAFAKQNRIVGNRYLNRARSLLDYASGHPRVENYRALQQIDASASRFGPLPIATSYTSYQTLKTSNALAEIPVSTFSDETFILAQAAVRQMAAEQSDGVDLGLFHQALDVADTVLDFSKGLGSGILSATSDTFVGIIDVVRHPIDTAKGFAQAIVHMDTILDAAIRSAVQVIEEYPNYSPEKKGEVIGEISFHIASAWFSMGLGKAGTTAIDLSRAGKVGELAQGVEKALSSARKTRQKISNLGESIPGTTIPKYFDIEVAGQVFHVNPNASKHMGEYIKSMPTTHNFPLRNDLLLSSFEGAVQEAVMSGAWRSSLNTRTPIMSGGWELIFSQRQGETWPVIIHALMKK